MRYAATLLVIATLAAGAVSAAPPSMKGAEFMPMAKVSLASARATALKARPGTITDQELEKEAGGSGLRYSFDVTSDGKTFEVGVDAKTGKVLQNTVEGAGAD